MNSEIIQSVNSLNSLNIIDKYLLDINEITYFKIRYSKAGAIILSNEHYELYRINSRFLEILATNGHIQLDNDYNSSLNFLPYGIVSISTGWAFNNSIDNLPTSIKHIHISNYRDDNDIINPDKLYCCFNQEISMLPYGLESLEIIHANDGNFHKSLVNLPPTLKKLKIINSIFSEINENDNIVNLNNFPESLEEIYFSYVTIDFINLLILPNSMRKIFIKPSNYDFLQKMVIINNGYDKLNSLNSNMKIIITRC